MDEENDDGWGAFIKLLLIGTLWGAACRAEHSLGRIADALEADTEEGK